MARGGSKSCIRFYTTGPLRQANKGMKRTVRTGICGIPSWQAVREDSVDQPLAVTMAVNEAEPERMFARLQKERGNIFCLQPPLNMT